MMPPGRYEAQAKTIFANPEVQQFRKETLDTFSRIDIRRIPQDAESIYLHSERGLRSRRSKINDSRQQSGLKNRILVDAEYRRVSRRTVQVGGSLSQSADEKMASGFWRRPFVEIGKELLGPNPIKPMVVNFGRYNVP